MKLLSKLLLLLAIFFIGCNFSEKSKELNKHICPQCNMPLSNSKTNTAKLIQNDKITYFDDIGCTILWAKKNNIDLKKVKVKIYTNDSKKYINPFKAYFAINEKTPMLYGFSAYENDIKKSINFDEVIIRMLRGEHMANPKIRKQILGY